MKNSKDIRDFWNELEDTLDCFGLQHLNPGDSDQQISQVNGREIQFTVHAPKDAKDASFRVEIHAETEDPKEVIQVAKAFKSTYL